MPWTLLRNPLSSPLNLTGIAIYYMWQIFLVYEAICKRISMKSTAFANFVGRLKVPRKLFAVRFVLFAHLLSLLYGKSIPVGTMGSEHW